MSTPEQAKEQMREMLQRGIESILEDAKVPLHTHLKIVEKLTERLSKSDETMKGLLDLVSKYESHLGEHSKEHDAWRAEAQRLTSVEHLKGEPGDAAPVVDEDTLAASIFKKVVPLIPEPIKGEPGEDGEDGVSPVIDHDAIVERVIESIQKNRSIDLSHIKNAQGFIKDQTRYKFEELMHGSGRTSVGGSGYQVPTAGAVDGSNRVFTWASAPNVIVLDNGNAMNKVSADGTINWTGTTTTTLAQAPNFNAYATA